MTTRSWIRKMFEPRRTRTLSRRPARSWLSLEALEERAVPTVSFDAGVNVKTGLTSPQLVMPMQLYGFLSLVTVDPSGQEISFNYGFGGSNFQLPRVLPTEDYQTPLTYSSSALALGDFDGDGFPDVITVDPAEKAVGAFLALPDPNQNGFEFDTLPVFSFGAGAAPTALAAGDFNGDKKLDLAVGNHDTGTVGVVEGLGGNGRFSPVIQTYNAGPNLSALAVGDFNNDGKLDIVTANNGNKTVSVLLGKGDGTFQTAVSYAVGSSPNSVAVGDFNGDGHLDIVTADSGANGVSVLTGNGDGTFKTAVAYAVGTDPTSVAVGDFNNDGRPDLVTANTGSNSVSVLVNNGSGGFQSAVDCAVGTAPTSVAVGDFNRDGKTDITTANSGSDTDSVLFNTSTLSIDANKTAVTVKVGSKVSNTGAFDDPFGPDTVTLTASKGTAVKNATNTGWTWSDTPSVGPSSSTVTITAKDTNGQQATTSFQLTVTGSIPTVTVADADGTYKGTGFAALGKAVGTDGMTPVTGTFTYAYYVGSSATGTSSRTAPSNAGTYTVVATFASTDANYGNGTAQTTFTIGKADATVVVTPYTVTYNGVAHSATVTSITGVNGQTGAAVGAVTRNSTHTNAGTFTTDTWSFAGTANYNNIASTMITDTISKANATVAVTPYTVTYDGAAHKATVTSITGVAGQTGATVGAVTLNTTHTVAGGYTTDTWSFAGTANYNNVASTTITDTINKANATVVVTPYTVTYDGVAHKATVTSITGVSGQTGATVGTVTLNSTHTAAGAYAADTWSFGGANYNSIANTTITDTINKANATVVITPYTLTYDGVAHSATVTSITGVDGQAGATVGAVTLDTTHANAGTFATDTWSFTGSANYNSIASTTITDTINKADATVVVTPYNVTFNDFSHLATITSITGVHGQTGATVGTVTRNTTHTNAGVFSTDSWSFTGTTNYNDIATQTITDTINKADAIIVVTPYTVTYDGISHTATVTSITGVNGQTGATVGTVDLSSTTHTAAGTYASDSWSFTGTRNYNSIATTSITDFINKADATVVVTPYTVTYDGTSHTASVTSITGVNGETGVTVGVVDLSGTTHTKAGTYSNDCMGFSGSNYNTISSTPIVDTINKADALVVVTPYTVTYDGASHTATVTSITGVNGETGATVGVVDLSGTTHTNAGTYSSDSWSFNGPNYNSISSTPIVDTINKANATVVVTPYTVTYDGNSHTATIASPNRRQWGEWSHGRRGRCEQYDAHGGRNLYQRLVEFHRSFQLQQHREYCSYRHHQPKCDYASFDKSDLDQSDFNHRDVGWHCE